MTLEDVAPDMTLDTAPLDAALEDVAHEMALMDAGLRELREHTKEPETLLEEMEASGEGENFFYKKFVCP